MHLFVFQSKLRRLNPRLYVDTERAVPVPDSDWRVAPLRLRQHRHSPDRSEVGLLPDRAAAEYLEAQERGLADAVLGGCPTNWVPEGDLFDPAAERPRLLARGWRSILLALAGRRLVSLEKARRIFNCSSLGLSSYDRLSLNERWLAEREDFRA